MIQLLQKFGLQTQRGEAMTELGLMLDITKFYLEDLCLRNFPRKLRWQGHTVTTIA